MTIENYGFETPRAGLASTAEEAARLAAQLGFPVALKIASPDVLHKTDVGGVELGLDSEGAVKAAFSRILGSVREKAPQARIEGVHVEEMCQEGVEVIIGLHNDPQFGPVVMFGLGGIFTEVLEDVSFRVLPITEDDARSMLREIRGRPLLEGYRGQPAVSEALLVALLMRASRLGLDLADRLDSVDLNPIAVWGDQHRVLDAKILLRPEARPLRVAKPNPSHLETFFQARAVALVGASATPGKIGNAVLESLSQHEYSGKIYPVNPSRSEIMGLPAYPDLASVPDDVELVVAVVDLKWVPELIEETAAKGAHNLVIVSGGGKELGGEREELEGRIKTRAAEAGVRVIGPNCIGIFDGQSRLDTFFQVHERMVRPPAGKVAMITQSGTVGCAFLEAASFGVSKFVSYGNRVDVDEADLLAYLAEDPHTAVIACYVEGFDQGRKFLETARWVAERKPVVIFKAARSRQGARASVSHTGFFGGSHAVCRGAFRQAGLLEVDSMEELLAAAKALAMQPEARGPRLAMISNGAGTLVQAIDLLEEYGLSLPNLTAETVRRLTAAYPPYYLVQNPVDVTGSATSEDYRLGLEALLEDPAVDIVMPWFVFQDTPLDEAIVDVLGALGREGGKPILCGAAGGPYTQEMSRRIEARGVPVFNGVRPWLVAARALAHRTLTMRR
ncbi:MAG: acetate--CoA ligase family protein [Anaerolineae bacterium]